MNTLFALNVGPLQWSVAPLQAGLLMVALLVLGRVTWLAQQRLQSVSPGRRLLVWGGHGLLFLACLLLLMPPSMPTKEGADVVLLTEGSPASTEVGPKPYAFGFDGAGEAAQRLQTPGQLLLESPGLTRLVVSGHGLSQAQWQQLPESLRLAWQAPALGGVTDVEWPARVMMGEAVVVTGQLRDEQGGARHELVLRDPAGVVVDRQSLQDGDRFSLRARPLTPGPVVYRLQLLQSEQMLSDDPVGFQVTTPSRARFHIVQSAPSFESRQFANWAGDHGAALLVQTQISRERDLLQRVNLDATESAGLTSEVLGQADMLWLDGRRWALLSSAERAVILDAIRDGLGMILTLDDALSDWLLTNAHTLGISVSRDADPQSHWLEDSSTDEHTPLPVTPWRMEPTGAEVFTRSRRGEVLESLQVRGKGRILVSRLAERHRWLTGGDRSRYTRYWARIIASIGRANDEPQWLSPTSLTELRVGERSAFCASLGGADALSLQVHSVGTTGAAVDERPLAMRAHLSGAPEACSFVWPERAGWQRFDLLDAAQQVRDVLWVNVLASDSFRTDQFARRQQATRSRLSMSDAGINSRSPSTLQPISRWWGWTLLLFALTPLWIERRLSQLD